MATTQFPETGQGIASKLEEAVARKLDLKVDYDSTSNSYRFWDEKTGKEYIVPTFEGYDKQFIMQKYMDLKKSVDKDRLPAEPPVNNLDEFTKLKDARVFTKEEIETLKGSLTNLKKRLELAAEAVRVADERAKDADSLTESYKTLAEEKVKENDKLIKKVQSLEDLVSEQSETIKTLTEQIIEMQG